MVARQAHNLKVVGSIPSSATKKIHQTNRLMDFFYAKNVIFMFFFCVCAIFVVPLHAILRAYTLFIRSCVYMRERILTKIIITK